MLPSLLGASLVILIILLVCLWRRLSIVQSRVLLCRCCPCHHPIPDPPGRIVASTETSALISNQADNRAVEHDFLGAKDKLNKPVQVEDGDLKDEYNYPGMDDRTVVA